MSDSAWRNRASPLIAQVLKLTAGKTKKEVDAALREAYPFGQRKYHPYKIWLDEIRRQRGGKKEVGTPVSYRKLAEWEAIYGKRSEA